MRKKQSPEAESKEKHGVRRTGPYAGFDYNLTICPLQSRLQHIYNGQPYARVDLNPILESTLSPSQGHWIWPQGVKIRLAVCGFDDLTIS
jgi:hypothetical protein